jgi:hypothetical protein
LTLPDSHPMALCDEDGEDIEELSSLWLLAQAL